MFPQKSKKWWRLARGNFPLTQRKESPATVLVGKLDRVLSEISMLPPGEYKDNMMKHLNSMCILTLLKYGSKTPKLEYVLKESSSK